jgi:hypothetical protein
LDRAESYKECALPTPREWEEIIQKLGIYAIHRISRYHWRTSSRRELPKGQESQDFVSAAITKLLDGTRSWNLAQNPDVLGALKDIVDSDIYHLFSSPDHLRRQSSSNPDTPDPVASMPTCDPGPEDHLKEKELDLAIRKCIAGESDLEILFAEIRKGKKPLEIAAELDCEPGEVYVIIRKLRRWLMRAGIMP